MKKRLILYILGVLIFIVIVVGITYAFMRPQIEEKESKSNISINACAKIQLKENNNSINLVNTYPMDDEMGLETDPYEFTISSTCENYVGFNLYLTSLNSNGIEDDKIHYAITNKNKDILSEGILGSQENGATDFNNEELKELDLGIKGEYKNIYRVYTNDLPYQDGSTYQLYLWVDKDAGNEVMGKSFQVGLSVKSYNRKETFAEYLIKNKDNSLIYHDGKCDYEEEENCDLETGDLSYRFVGANPNNYICFGGDCSNDPNDPNYKNLYRIIGLFKNELNLYEIKLIKADYANSDLLGKGANTPNGLINYETDGSYYTEATYGPKLNVQNFPEEQDAFAHRYRGSLNAVDRYRYQENGMVETNADWPKALLNTIHLNHNFLNSFDVNWQNKITKHDWKYKGNTWLEIAVGSKDNAKTIKNTYDHELGKDSNPITYNAKIGLMYVSDYLYAASSNNWTKWPINNVYTYNVNGYDTENIPIGTYGGTDGTDYRSAIDENWLYMGLWEWTITQLTDSPGNLSFILDAPGNVDNTYVGMGRYVVRPCFYLSSDVKKFGGTGTENDPFKLSK